MPINLYIGQSRSGKSYEVVTEPILNSLRIGRRVLSNIPGLNYLEIREHLIREGVEPDKIGELVQVTHEQVNDEYFFRTDLDDQNGVQTFVQPGDLVALDEVWRFWKKRGDLPARHQNFMRMHGHMVNQTTGLTCEVALISQALRDINENIRDNTHQTYYMQKMTKVGVTKAYIVSIYDKASTSKSAFITSFQRIYNTDYFKFYQSHSQNQGGLEPKEVHSDKRGNMLLSKRFVLFIPMFLLMSVGAFYYLYKFMHPEAKPNEQLATTATSDKAVSPDNPAPANAPAPEVPQPLTTWRIVGYYQNGPTLTLVLRNDAGSTRYVPDPPNIRLAGLDIGAVLGSEVYSNWTGGEAQRPRSTP